MREIWAWFVDHLQLPRDPSDLLALLVWLQHHLALGVQIEWVWEQKVWVVSLPLSA